MLRIDRPENLFESLRNQENQGCADPSFFRDARGFFGVDEFRRPSDVFVTPDRPFVFLLVSAVMGTHATP